MQSLTVAVIILLSITRSDCTTVLKTVQSKAPTMVHLIRGSNGKTALISAVGKPVYRIVSTDGKQAGGLASPPVVYVPHASVSADSRLPMAARMYFQQQQQASLNRQNQATIETSQQSAAIPFAGALQQSSQQQPQAYRLVQLYQPPYASGFQNQPSPTAIPLPPPVPTIPPSLPRAPSSVEFESRPVFQYSSQQISALPEQGSVQGGIPPTPVQVAVYVQSKKSSGLLQPAIQALASQVESVLNGVPDARLSPGVDVNAGSGEGQCPNVPGRCYQGSMNRASAMYEGKAPGGARE